MRLLHFFHLSQSHLYLERGIVYQQRIASGGPTLAPLRKVLHQLRIECHAFPSLPTAVSRRAAMTVCPPL